MHRTVGMLGAPLMVALLTGCGSLDDFEEVITDEATLPTMNRVPGNPVTGSYGGDFKNLQLSKGRSFENNGVEPGDVDAIFVKDGMLEIDTGTNNADADRLSIYVQSMTLWVEAPGQPRKTIADLPTVPDGKTAAFTIPAEFATSAADDGGTGLKPYAVAERMEVGADVVLTEAGAATFLNVKLKTTLTLLIDINILGF